MEQYIPKVLWSFWMRSLANYLPDSLVKTPFIRALDGFPFQPTVSSLALAAWRFAGRTFPLAPESVRCPVFGWKLAPWLPLALGIIWFLGWVDSGCVLFDRQLCSFLNGAAACSCLITPSFLL